VAPERELVERAFGESVDLGRALLDGDLPDAVVEAVELLARALEGGGKLLLFGNGGSAADATHVAAEFVGRFLLERPAAAALSLSDNASAVTAIANDYGFETVFARQIEALGRPGDAAIAISTSGASPNVLAGLRTARERGLHTIGLIGARGVSLADYVDVLLAVPSDSTPRIQEAHTLIAHVLCELVERRWS
jgi:D-sedoheptulose 7-phosphate isomerase